MSRWITALAVLLLLQCGLVAAVYWQGENQKILDRQSLAYFPGKTIDEVRIGDEFDNEVILVKHEKFWLVESIDLLPANPVMVKSLLRSVVGRDHGWPVAESSAARQRFQVADYYYQRRLEFFSGGAPLGTIYLGTSPGFRRVHARNHQQDAIYSISFNAFDAPAAGGSWLEPKLLQVRSMLEIVADSYSLHYDNGKWRSGIGGVPDSRELEALLNAIETLQIDGVASQEAQRELATAEADLTLTIRSLGGEATREVFTLEGQHYIHSSDYPQFFKLSAYDFDRLTGIDFALLSGEVPPSPAPQGVQ